MAKPKSKAGRIAIFRGKQDGVRVQGTITKDGAVCLDSRRVELAELYEKYIGHERASISDGEVIEYLARGQGGTVEYLIRHVRS